jgi:signal transduction histidine kinase
LGRAYELGRRALTEHRQAVLAMVCDAERGKRREELLRASAEFLAQFARIKEKLNEDERHLRRYSHGLRPTTLDDLGWIPAIRFMAGGISKRANLSIHIDAAGPGRPLEMTLYRFVQEALTNAVKHTKTSNKWIRAWRENLVRCCSIRDDRGGFDSSQAHAAPSRRGLRLIVMQADHCV